VYIDGTKIEANANRYKWVWKKSCLKNRSEVYEKLTALIQTINEEALFYHGVKCEAREEYSIEYVGLLLSRYCELTGVCTGDFVSGRDHRKVTEQKRYEELLVYYKRLKKYAKRIETCGEHRNSYSKTDMRNDGSIHLLELPSFHLGAFFTAPLLFFSAKIREPIFA